MIWTSRNNTIDVIISDIQRIPDSVPDDHLKEKVIEIFNQINVKVNTFDIEDCHRMGKSKKTTIVRIDFIYSTTM